MPTQQLPETPLTAESHVVAGRWVLSFAAPTIFFYQHSLPPGKWPVLKYVVEGWDDAVAWSLLLNANAVAFVVFLILAFRFFAQSRAKSLAQQIRDIIDDLNDQADPQYGRPSRPYDEFEQFTAKHEGKKKTFQKLAAGIHVAFSNVVQLVLPFVLGAYAMVILVFLN